jgi:hypothetical protein
MMDYEGVMAYFKVLTQHLLEQTEDYEKPQS